jgi:hypothetical protein
MWGLKHHSLTQRPLVKLAFITKSILEEKTVIVFSQKYPTEYEKVISQHHTA